MNKRDEFFDILNAINIDSLKTPDEIGTLLHPIGQWLMLNTPSKLYRFMSAKEYNIDAFKNDQIWGSLPLTFNDPFECLPSYDMNRINNELYFSLTLENLKMFFSGLKQGYKIPQMALMPIEMQEKLFSILNSDEFDKSLEENFDWFRKAFSGWWEGIQNDIVKMFFSLFISRQKQEYIACFSEINDATLMWAHYAESHKGFCLEFNWQECLLQNQKGYMIYDTALLAPVKYSATRYDATSYIYTITESCITGQMDISPYFRDYLASMKALLTKSLDWSYEKEWRMFTFDEKIATGEAHKALLTQKPTALYIGARTPNDVEEKLNEIAIGKGIPCYKMLQSFADNRFVVEPMPYNDYLHYRSMNQ